MILEKARQAREEAEKERREGILQNLLIKNYSWVKSSYRKSSPGKRRGLEETRRRYVYDLLGIKYSIEFLNFF